MKKFLLFILVLVMIFMCSCNLVLSKEDQNNLEIDETVNTEIEATEAYSEIVDPVEICTDNNEKRHIVLPISKKTVRIRSEYEKFIPYVTNELLSDAEKTIKENLGGVEGGCFYLEVDSEGYLCLGAEAIVYIPEDQVDMSKGCGNHVHRFASARISSKIP